MRRAKAIILLLTLAAGLQAQELRNSGAHIVLTNGSHLVIQGDYINQEGGLLHQDGTVWLTGSFTNNSTTNALSAPDGSDNIRFNGASTQTIGGTYTGVHTLEGVSVETGSILEVPCGTQVTLMGNLTAGGALSLKANGDRTTASLIVKGDIHNESGTVGYERWVPAGAFEYFSSPIVNQTASVFAPLGTGPPSNGLFAYDITNDVWAAAITTEATPIVAMQGYAFIANAASTIAFSGDAYHNGEQSIALTKSATTGFNLVGNPYPSAISWELDAGWGREVVNPNIWINYADASGEGNFATYNHDSEVATNWEANVGTDLGVIAPTQAFWVLAGADGATLTVKPAAQVHSANRVNKKSATANPLIRLQAQREGYSDEMVIYFHSEATEALDRYDTRKKLGSGAYPQLYSPVTDGILAVNSLPLPPPETRTVVPITLKSSVAGELTLSLTELKAFGENSEIHLVDRLLDRTVNLMEQPIYTIDVEDAGEIADRFEVVIMMGEEQVDDPITDPIDPIGGINLTETQTQPGISIYAHRKSIYVGNVQGRTHVSVLNIAGQRVLSRQLEAELLNAIHTNLPAGVYIVEARSGSGREVKRVFIE